jgi:sugar lactone lactonase YvrE
LAAPRTSGVAQTAPPASAAADPSAVRLGELRAEIRQRPTGAALYALAYYAAKVGRADEALQALRRLDETGWDGGLADDAFPLLSPLPAYRALSTALAARLPLAHRSVAGFVVLEQGLHAEGIAYDADRGSFYVGSTTSGRILSVDATGRAHDVVQTGYHEVLGLKVGGPDHVLWAACSDDDHPTGDSCAVAVDPETGTILRRACLAGPGHEVNDLAVASDGTVYATDSTSGEVLRLGPARSKRADPNENDGPARFEPLVAAGILRGTNGIALGAGGRVLLVAHGRGIARIDLATGALGEVTHPPSAAFVGIDGMALRDRTLYAIANTYGRARVVRIDLDLELARVERFEVLESNHPAWDEPTTGALGPDGFYYIADSQLGSEAPPRETIVLKLPYGE